MLKITFLLFPFSARGDDLFARIDGDSLPEFEAVKILKQVLEALKYMHDRGFMHLDLKVRFDSCSIGNAPLKDWRKLFLAGYFCLLLKTP